MEADASAPAFADLPSDSGGHNGNDNTTVIAPSSVPDTTNNNNNTPATSVVPANGSWQREATEAVNGGIISCADFYPQAAKHLPKAKTGTLELSTVNSTDATHSSTPNGQISSPTSNFSSSLPISAPVPMPSSSSITPSFSSSSYLLPSEQSSPPRPPLTIEPPIEVSSHSTSPTTTATATATLLKETTNLESMVISNSSLMSNPLVEAITSSSLDLQHLSTSSSDNHQHRHHHHHHHHHHHQSKKNKKKKNKDKDKDKDRSHKESKHSKGSFSEEDNNAVDGMLLTTDPAADLTTITTFPVSSEEDTESVKLKKKKKKKSKDKDKDREERRSEKNGHSDEGEEGGESRKEEKKKRKRKHHHSKSGDDTAVVGEGESVLQNTDASASSATFFQPSLLESAFGTSSLSAPADEGAGGASTSAPVAVSTTTTDSTIAADNNSEHAGSSIGELSEGNFHQEAPLMVNSNLPALPASTATSDMDVGDNPTLPITSTTANSISMPSSAQEQLQQQQQQPAMNPGPKKVKKIRKRKTAAAATSSSSTLVSNSTTATTTTSLPVIPIDTTAAANAPLSIVHNDPTIATTSTTTNPPTENPLPISLLLTPPPKRVRIRRKRDPNAPPAKRGRPFGAKTHPYKLKRNQQLIKQLQQQQQQQIQQQISPSSSAAAAAAVLLPPESLAALAGAAQTLPTTLVPLSATATATATATTPTTPSPQKRGRKPVKVKLEEISPNQANQSIESTQSTPPRSSTRIRKNSEIKDQIKQEELSDEKSNRDGKRKRRGRKANKEVSATGVAAAATTSKPTEAMDTVSAIIDSVATQATTDSFSPPPPPPPPLLLSPTVKQAKKKPAKAKQSGPMSFAELEAKVERVLAGNVSGTYTTTTTTATSSASLAFDDVKPVVPSSSSSSAVKLEEKSLAKKRGRKSKKEMLEKSLQEQGNKGATSTSASPLPGKLSQTDSGPLSISSVLANNRVPLAIQRTRFIGPVVRIVKQGTDVQAVLQELGASGSGSSPSKKSKKSTEKEKKKTKSGKKGSNLGGGSTVEDEDRRAEEEGDSEFAMPFQYSICQRQTQLDGRGLVEESDSQSAGGSGGAGGSNGGGTSGTGSGGSSGGGRSLQAIHQNLMAEMGGNTSTEGWTCAFCSLPPDASSLGDLYGPYYVDLVTTPDVDYELMPPPSCRLAHAVGRKRSRILTERLRPEDDLPRQQYELWFHNECFCWTPRVLLDPAGQLLFIEEAITQAKRTICFVCRRPGATLSCFDRDCIFQALHYPCAKYIGCYFDEQRLSVFCGPHFNVYWPGCNVFERRLASTAASLEPKTPLAERLVERLRRNEETAQVLRLTGGASLAARVAASDCGPNVAPGRQVPVHFDR